MDKNEITIVINAFKSQKKLLKCLESIEPQFKVILIENSEDEYFKKKIEKKFVNLECVVTGENLGYAKGNNLGLSKVKSKYALILNPDAILAKDAIKNFFITADLIKNFAIIGPAIQESHNVKKIKKIIEVDSVKGFAMFLNLEEFKDIGFFDSNFFIYLEEIDLCKRLKKNNKKIFLDPSILINHQGGSSHNEKYNYEMELSRNWHWMWSIFYYNKKYRGFVFAFFLVLPYLFSSFSKIVFYSLVFNKNKRSIYSQRLSGLFNSITGKESWYRPKVY
jgi:N-acetylglucosaminyl-diphospho-decaprenol L-rhamnosyltransferase